MMVLQLNQEIVVCLTILNSKYNSTMKIEQMLWDHLSSRHHVINGSVLLTLFVKHQPYMDQLEKTI
jgi:hypothetical protein